jgi:transposase
MILTDLLVQIKDEVSTEEFLRSKSILKLYVFCSKCNSERLGRIRRDKYKCYSCKAEWSIRSGSFLETTNIAFSDFLLCIKFFELEIGVNRTAEELKLTPKVVSKIYNHIRSSILDNKDFLIDNTPINKHTPLIAITASDHIIHVVLIGDQDISGLEEGSALIIGHRSTDAGSNVFYDFQCKFKRNIKQQGKTLKTIYDVNRFWSFAIERLISIKTSTVEGYYLFMKEIAFRYNNRNVDLFDKIIEHLKA